MVSFTIAANYKIIRNVRIILVEIIKVIEIHNRRLEIYEIYGEIIEIYGELHPFLIGKIE